MREKVSGWQNALKKPPGVSGLLASLRACSWPIGIAALSLQKCAHCAWSWPCQKRAAFLLPACHPST